MINRNTFIIVIAIVSLIIGFLGGEHFNRSSKSMAYRSTSPVVTSKANPQKPLPPRPLSAIAGIEWQEYRQARDKVLHDNPELMAKYQKLMKEAAAQEQALDAAMVEADPKVAPAISKLQQLRSHNSVATK